MAFMLFGAFKEIKNVIILKTETQIHDGSPHLYFKCNTDVS